MVFSALLLAAAPQAKDGVSYNFVEVNYVRSTADTNGPLGNLDGDGGRLGFSVEFLDSFYFTGDYEVIDFDNESVDVMTNLGTVTVEAQDLDVWSAGLGWHTGLSETNFFASDRWSLYAEARYVSLEFDGSSAIDGVEALVGLRVINNSDWEFQVGLGHRELDDADSGLIFDGRMLYNITRTLEVFAGINYVEDLTQGQAGVRYNFGRVTQ